MDPFCPKGCKHGRHGTEYHLATHQEAGRRLVLLKDVFRARLHAPRRLAAHTLATGLQKGDRVKMTSALKAKMRGQCLPEEHVDLSDDGCLRCSTDHIEEFGECTGIVDGLLDYNNVPPGDPAYDLLKVGPEVDVRWQPSGLRYGYHPDDLEKLP